MAPKGDNPTTKKRKVVKDSKGNPVKTGTGGTATSNDYSKSKPKAAAKKTPAAKKKAPAKKAPVAKKAKETKTDLKRAPSKTGATSMIPVAGGPKRPKAKPSATSNKLSKKQKLQMINMQDTTVNTKKKQGRGNR